MITIDDSELRKMTLKLKDLHRAALPNAVRFTLNDLAFDVKKNTLVPAFKKQLIVRNEQFIKRYSGVQKATGWNIESMYSEVGMKPESNASKAVENLKQQDIGGKIDERNYIPDDKARQGGLRAKKVRKNNYLANIKLSGHVQFGDKQGLIRAVTRSKIEKNGTGKGIAVIYGTVLYEIRGFKRNRKKNSIFLNLNKLYTYKKDRSITVKASHFMSIAAMQASNKMQEIFNKNAEMQLKKFTT